MLTRKSFFIREHVGFLKLSDTYDILDPESQAQIGIAKEKVPALVHVLRFLLNKQMLPTRVHVYEGADFENESRLKFTISRGFSLLRPKVDILDPRGGSLGWLRSKAFTLGGAFTVFDASGNEVARVKGDWKGWNFRLTDRAGREVGTITKKWAGIGKELFTSADNYIIALDPSAAQADALLLLAAGLAVDVIYKER
jgi:uncharacterized protein YxjI